MTASMLASTHGSRSRSPTTKFWADAGDVSASTFARTTSDRGRILIDAEAAEAVPHQVDQIAAFPASGVEHPPPPIETAAQQLIEQVDVDVAELVAKRDARGMRIRHQPRGVAAAPRPDGSRGEASRRTNSCHRRAGVAVAAGARLDKLLHQILPEVVVDHVAAVGVEEAGVLLGRRGRRHHRVASQPGDRLLRA